LIPKPRLFFTVADLNRHIEDHLDEDSKSDTETEYRAFRRDKRNTWVNNRVIMNEVIDEMREYFQQENQTLNTAMLVRTNPEQNWVLLESPRFNLENVVRHNLLAGVGNLVEEQFGLVNFQTIVNIEEINNEAVIDPDETVTSDTSLSATENDHEASNESE